MQTALSRRGMSVIALPGDVALRNAVEQQPRLHFRSRSQLKVKHFIVKDDQAVVELHSGATAKNRMRFDNRYCWVVYFRDNVIVHARAYLDSAMVARLFAENSMFGCAWPRIDPTT